MAADTGLAAVTSCKRKGERVISRTLRPIDLIESVSFEEELQAFAFVDWARYADEAPPDRIETAMKRAWGFDSVVFFQRVLNTMPAFVVARWSTNNLRRVLIAVEPSHSANQFFNVASITGAMTGQTGGGDGLVLTNFQTAADLVWTALNASPVLVDAMHDPRAVVTWAGHSLGAAVADLNAIRFKRARPSAEVRLIKFGAPCVGNDMYVNRSYDRVRRSNVYVDQDPIFMWPTSEIRTFGGFASLVWSGPVREPSCFRWNMINGDVACNYSPFPVTYSRLHQVRDLGLEINTDNPWYYHLMGSYRCALMSAAARSRDLAFYRFNFLEFSNENYWQAAHATGRRDWENWYQVDDPPPAEVPPPSAQIDELAVAPAEEGAGGGGGDWGGAAIPGPGFNADVERVMQPLAGPVKEWGVITPPAQVSQQRFRRSRG